MLKYICLIIFNIYFFKAFSQTAPSRYWVQFTNKANNPFSLEEPEAYLSQRALDRRAKQNISIVKNDLPITPSYIDSIINKGASIVHCSKWFNAVTIKNADTTITDSLLLEKINHLPFVQKIDSVAYMEFGKQPGIEPWTGKTQADINYGMAYNQIAMVNGDVIHRLGYKGEGMWIAVMDNGFINVDQIKGFDSLRMQNRIKEGYDFVQEDKTLYDGGGHGTSVLSVMAANLPGEIVGTAPNATYWLFKTEAPFEYRIEEDNWVAAAEYADSLGIDVINTSLGYNEFDKSSMNYTLDDIDGNTARITIGADIAASKGMLVVNSAGNEGNSSWGKVTAPGDGDSVFTIGAVNSSGNYAPFSSRGPTADGRIKPNVVGQGQGTFVLSTSGNLGTSNGTSFSSPLIAGISTCLWQAFPNKTNIEIINAIQQSASQANNPDDKLGYGIPDYFCAYLLLKNLDCNIIGVLEDTTAFPIPNAFSPNGDGLNDVFEVVAKEIIEELYSFKIYNRWGELVYKTNNKDQGWNGYYNNQLAPVGVYSYSMSYRRIDGVEEQYMNIISLIR